MPCVGPPVAIFYEDVAAHYRERLHRGLQLVQERVRERRGSLPRKLQSRLTAFLGAHGPEIRIIIQRGDPGYWACSMGYCVWIRPRCFARWSATDGPRLPAVLFHELVHVAGGSELDAEAFENALFTPREGAVMPTAADWTDFAAQRYRSEWLSVAPKTGVVRDGKRRVVCRFTRKRGQAYKEEAMAETKKGAKPEKLGVEITVKFTGHLKKADLDMFTKSLGSVLNVHLENGGNGN